VAEEDEASRLLEEENIRLVESRSSVEAERDALRIEILHIKNELEAMKEAYVVNSMSSAPCKNRVLTCLVCAMHGTCD
jgi:hypothetical protein